MYILIGGIEQWIQIEGDNADNPVLLFLHGGPGGSTRMAAAAWKSWERYFTVAHWDQRGAGKTFERNGAEGCGKLTLERMIADGIEVVEFLRAHFRKDKIILIGHSWGSVLGIHMVKRRPELFAAFVSTGQLVNLQRNEEFNYTRQLQWARAAGNGAALAALNEIGPPPYRDLNKLRILREWADVLVPGNGDDVRPRPPLPSTDFSAEDRDALMKGFMFTGSQLYEEFCAIDLPALGFDFDIPMFCIMGEYDQQTPMELAKEYFDAIKAPRKKFICIEGCHHFVQMNRPDDFLQSLLECLQAV
ncbi:MAG: alpha/beta hydrolase [Spongiibacteraceae bacterium]